MHRRRFFVSLAPQANQATVSGEEAHHLIHVLRAQVGDSIELIDGSGSAWRGQVAEIDSTSVIIRDLIELPRSDASPNRLILVQSLCKSDKLEWILQKVTELGISEIRLLAADRSVLKIPEGKIQAKLERWNKIVLGAAKQCRRSTLPHLHAPDKCAAICQSIEADLKMVLSEDETQSTLKTLLKRSSPRSVAFCIGPEGGWTTPESEIFSHHGIQPVTLGPSILRTETAAIVTTAILKYELENPEFND
jgi:16S rRNA (uracil1498-N3)-methyltransferase